MIPAWNGFVFHVKITKERKDVWGVMCGKDMSYCVM